MAKFLVGNKVENAGSYKIEFYKKLTDKYEAICSTTYISTEQDGSIKYNLTNAIDTIEDLERNTTYGLKIKAVVSEDKKNEFIDSPFTTNYIDFIIEDAIVEPEDPGEGGGGTDTPDNPVDPDTPITPEEPENGEWVEISVNEWQGGQVAWVDEGPQLQIDSLSENVYSEISTDTYDIYKIITLATDNSVGWVAYFNKQEYDIYDSAPYNTKEVIINITEETDLEKPEVIIITSNTELNTKIYGYKAT